MAEIALPTASPEPETQLAALDLGSNSFHLIVAQQHNGRIHVVDRLKEMVRLAAGLDAADTLSRAMDRGIECLSRFGQRLRHLKADSVRVVGTNTLRKARNGWEFISRAEAVIGHPIEIISGREEARLIYKGVCYAMGPAVDRRLVIDIGGGSTELILGRGYEPELIDSLYMGCVSMSERFFESGELKASRFAAAELAARQELEPVETLYRRRGWDSVIGTSGTIHALNDVARGFGGAADGLTMTALNEITKALVAARHIDQVSLEGLASERTPVFAGGLAILRAIFDGLRIERLTVSSGALREGLLQELIGRVRHEDVREHSVADLAHRYHVDEPHARNVADTAQMLLAQVTPAWGLADNEHERLLRWGALVHEIGMDVSHSQYHKHGHYLLQNMDLAGFSQTDKLRLGLLVRAHRRKFPKLEFEAIDADERATLVRLAVLLRLAVVLRRNRIGDALPPIVLRADADRLNVTIPAEWLDAHPLTRLDLEQESEFLAVIPLRLDVTGT